MDVKKRYFPATAGRHEPDTMCFIERMDYYPNQECMYEFCPRELPRIRARLAAAGRARMLSNHDRDRSMQRLDLIIEHCVAAHAARPVPAGGVRSSGSAAVPGG